MRIPYAKPFTEEELIEALKIAFNTSDVKKADQIFDGELSYSIDDVKYVTIFRSTNSMIEFYTNALRSDEISVIIDFMNRYLGENIWKQYVDVDSLKQFLLNSIKGKSVDGGIKYDIDKNTIKSLEHFFDFKNLKDRRTVDKILMKFTTKQLLTDSIESALLRINGMVVYLPKSDQYVKAFEWNQYK